MGRVAIIMKANEALSVSQTATFFITLILLILKITDDYWPTWIFGSDLVNTSFEYYYVGFTLLAIAIIILANKEDLSIIHVDKPYIALYFLSGILYSWYIWGSLIGFATIIAMLILFDMLRRKQLFFGEKKSSSYYGYIFISLIPFIISVIFISPMSFFRQIAQDSKLTIWIVYKSCWYALFVEIVFRGSLWMLLRIRNLQNIQIFITHLLLYTASFVLKPNIRPSFAFIIPLLVGAWQGGLVWKSKSLTPGTLGYSLVIILFRVNDILLI